MNLLRYVLVAGTLASLGWGDGPGPGRAPWQRIYGCPLLSA